MRALQSGRFDYRVGNTTAEIQYRVVEQGTDLVSTGTLSVDLPTACANRSRI